MGLATSMDGSEGNLLSSHYLPAFSIDLFRQFRELLTCYNNIQSLIPVRTKDLRE